MKKMDKKAFTLIELIVIIAVLGVLVLLASPRFFGYTQSAELTKGFANAKSIEKASEFYYMDHEDWPRLTDEPYTSEEIESYSERIFNHTGHEVNLDPEGNYYDIDYDKLSDYIQVPDDKKNYILQNPVGKIYYMENLNEVGVARVNYSSAQENQEVSPIDEIIEDYENVIYIDSELTKALREAKAGDLIVLDKGVYQINSLLDIHDNYGVDIIGQGSDTIIEVNKSADLSKSIKNNIYKLAIQPSSNFNKSKYILQGPSYNKITFEVEYNNVLFKDPYNRLIKNQRHSAYINGDSSRNVAHNYKKMEFNNCISIDMPLVSVWSDYNDQRVKPNVKITNSATNVNKLDTPNSEYGLNYAHDILIKTTSLENAIFDDNYNIISHPWQSVGTGTNSDGSQAHIGLYGGPFGW